ncbi:MAG: glycosyltransferase [Muribaculaceae bacterium]|nr:glycosyltransferase [Muribaculaceae bacterium]
MKILHVITSLRTGGAEHLMVDLLPKLRVLGNDVELLLFNGKRTPFYEELEDKGVTIHSFGMGGNVYHPKNILRLTRYLRKYDIIHTHNTACQLFVPLAKILSHNHTKLVTTEHNATNRRRNKWYLKPFDKWMYSRYNHVICIADQTYANLVDYIGNKPNLSTIFNGIDVSRFINPIKDISKKDRFIITMAAAFREQKDQDTLVRAINDLPDNYILRLIGDGQRRKEIEDLADCLNVSNRVDFLGIRTDIPELLRESDINVLSSHWEGLSLSSIEGMASGRPFIASDVDGLREVVKNAGVLFPHGNHKVLADSIRELCDNPLYYREVAERCQSKAKQFDISIMAEKYNELYKSL